MSLEKKFKFNPLEFMKRYAVLPKENLDLYSEKNYSLLKIKDDNDKITYGMFEFIKKKDGNEVGAVALKAYQNKGIKMFYLPWKSKHITSMNLRSKNKASFFFTAAINGCSVFVSGTAQNPTVSHAGITTDLISTAYTGEDKALKIYAGNRNAPAFWRRLFLLLTKNKIEIKAEVNRTHYIKDGTLDTFDFPVSKLTSLWGGDINVKYESVWEHPGTTKRAFEFTKNLKEADINCQLVLPWGCFWGMKSNKTLGWYFYLQENVTVIYQDKGITKASSVPLAIHQVFPGGWTTVYTRSRLLPTHTTRRIQIYQ